MRAGAEPDHQRQGSAPDNPPFRRAHAKLRLSAEGILPGTADHPPAWRAAVRRPRSRPPPFRPSAESEAAGTGREASRSRGRNSRRRGRRAPRPGKPARPTGATRRGERNRRAAPTPRFRQRRAGRRSISALRPADGPEVFLLHGFAKIRIQQQFVSAQAGCKAVIRLAGLHCFHKSTF